MALLHSQRNKGICERSRVVNARGGGCYGQMRNGKWESGRENILAYIIYSGYDFWPCGILIASVSLGNAIK